MSYKVLGQSAPAAATPVDLYTVPTAKTTVISSIFVCNRGTETAFFRVLIRPGGAAATNAQHIYYDAPVAGNATFAVTGGMTIGAGDVVTVQSSSTELSFSVFGKEND